MSCDHRRIASKVIAVIISNPEPMPNHYRAEIEIKCMQCGIPFRFANSQDLSMVPAPRTSKAKLIAEIVPWPSDLPVGSNGRLD